MEKSILIIDDEKSLIRLLKGALEAEEKLRDML